MTINKDKRVIEVDKICSCEDCSEVVFFCEFCELEIPRGWDVLAKNVLTDFRTCHECYEYHKETGENDGDLTAISWGCFALENFQGEA
tara:strand:+ start:1673 stop:1936 length:264 start_codon:yes stop_codon:yes gene_type:complete